MLDDYGNIIPENTDNAPEPVQAVSPEPIQAAAPEPAQAIRPEPIQAIALEPVQASAPSPELFYRETIKNETRKRDNGKLRRGIAIAVVASLVGGGSLGLGIGIGVPLANGYFLPRLMDDREEVNAFRFDDQASAQTVGAFDGDNVGYAALVASAEPSVVNITANVSREQQYGGFIIPQEGQSAGSGILFLETETKYYVVTNNHVITGARDVYVSIEGSEGIPASPVGGDADNDLAVISILKTDAVKAGVTKAVIAVFGDSDAMRMGDAVLAIGNALGEGNTATNGIVSAPIKDVYIPESGISLTLLQTNAAINEGNSGGPLLNMRGEVIGINTIKLSSSGMNSASIEGMGYAIPSNIVKPIIEGFLQSKPMLGVQINDISAEMARQFNLPQAGVIILGIVSGSPAEKAGLQLNDIVTGVNDAPVLTSQQLIDTVQQYQIGDTVNVKIIRNGTEFLTIPVKLAEREVTTF